MSLTFSSSDNIVVVEDGKDAVLYSLVTSVDTVRFDSNNIPSPNNIVVTAYRTIGNNARELTTEMSIRYRKIKGSAGDYVNKGKVSQFSIDIASSDFDLIEITGLINNVEITRRTVPAILDGKNGENGSPGPLMYPYGSWNKLSNYTRTETECPYVLYDTGNTETDLLYYPKEIGTIAGDSDNLSPNQDNRWKAMNYFESIQTKIIIARFGLLGKAVFYDDYMFSQDGVDLDGNPTSNYRGFPDGTFIPNLKINLKTGEIYAADIELIGKVTATEGIFNGFVLIPYKIDSGTSITFPDIKDGTNIMLTNSRQELSVTLPTDLKYNGIEVEIMNASFGVFTTYINQPGNGSYLYWRSEQISQIKLLGDYSTVKLKAFISPTTNKLLWRVVNTTDFSKSGGGASGIAYIQWIQG